MAKDSFKIEKSVTLKPQSTEPTLPTNGDIYYDSMLQQLRAYVDGEWISLSENDGYARIFMDI